MCPSITRRSQKQKTKNSSPWTREDSCKSSGEDVSLVHTVVDLHIKDRAPEMHPAPSSDKRRVLFEKGAIVLKSLDRSAFCAPRISPLHLLTSQESEPSAHSLNMHSIKLCTDRSFVASSSAAAVSAVCSVFRLLAFASVHSGKPRSSVMFYSGFRVVGFDQDH